MLASHKEYARPEKKIVRVEVNVDDLTARVTSDPVPPLAPRREGVDLSRAAMGIFGPEARERIEFGKTEVNLHDNPDARAWAKEFCRINPMADVGSMIGWFANAIICGHDYASREQRARETRESEHG